MRALALVMGLAALAACGPRVVVDVEPEGSGGGPTGSGGSAASTGGSDASGGSPEGSGGSGGGPAGDCGVAACQDKTSACYAFGQCQYAAHGVPAEVTACETSEPDGAAAWRAMVACVCASPEAPTDFCEVAT